MFRKPRSRRSLRTRMRTPYFRPLRVEPLEERRLLAVITVTNALDVVNGYVQSFDTLIANDGGDGISLREAILASEYTFTFGDNTIFFDSTLSGQTITLSGTELEVFTPFALTIDARNLPENVTIDANHQSRVFRVIQPTRDVFLAGLTLQNGDATGPDSGGGIGFFSTHSLSLVRSTVSGNTSVQRGGGIYAPTGNVLLINSTVSGNTSENDGGGIFTYSGNISLTSSVVSDNTADGLSPEGGGISTRTGNVSLTSSTVSGNTVASSVNLGHGGGVFSAEGNVSLTVSTVSDNHSDYSGGGIFSGGAISITNSTISGNTSVGPGGGVLSLGGSVLLANSTVSGNTCEYGGGGILIVAHPTLTITNSIVARNIDLDRNSDPDLKVTTSTTLSVHHSLIGDNTTTGLAEAQTPDANGNLIGTSSMRIDPLLGPLADNGGPTQTRALLPGSPALDAGDPNFDPADPDGNPLTNDALPYDQRSDPYRRVFDGDETGGARIDMGAFEVIANDAISALFGDYNRDGRVDAADYTAWRDNLGANIPPLTGADGDGDGLVGATDYQVWKSHYGFELALSGAAAVQTSSQFETADAAFTMYEPPTITAGKFRPTRRQGIVGAASHSGAGGSTGQRNALLLIDRPAAVRDNSPRSHGLRRHDGPPTEPNPSTLDASLAVAFHELPSNGSSRFNVGGNG